MLRYIFIIYTFINLNNLHSVHPNYIINKHGVFSHLSTLWIIHSSLCAHFSLDPCRYECVTRSQGGGTAHAAGCVRGESWLADRCCGLFKRRAESRFPIVREADYSLSAAAISSQLIGGFPLQGNKQALPVCSAHSSTMDFNVKKLASDAGVFFTRAVQVSRSSFTGHRAVRRAAFK